MGIQIGLRRLGFTIDAKNMPLADPCKYMILFIHLCIFESQLF